MDKDKQNQTTDQQSETNNQSKNISISPDKWNEMQTQFKHMSNTVHNLSTKLENKQKRDIPNPKPNKPSSNDKTGNKNFVSRDEFNKLVDENKKLADSVKSKHQHDDVIKHAKDALKMNNMHVSSTTFNHLLGSDNQATDENIDWFKKIYKAANAKPKHFPHQTKHDTNKPNLGIELAKSDQEKTNNNMRSLDQYMK